ncbi:GNAT family N-acetyltransferase [Paracoccus sp. MBLB3053]|uniref:GNAT family N-acetyltransferase n=1 Tax=Paracoccus aurantius TaxID=3073814 RepID=A0ABU2HR24_9RHOB|nr:GNAT family N-acetyltransferase [Paracoccus sp. MBLB3053]MDS9467504.1 GNAT family N-acetyltransferase [Paracoccus sp. MBLB3053]
MTHGIETLRADVPVIETDRLILRAPRFEDLEAITAFGLSDRSRHVGGPMTDWQSWHSLIGMIGHWVIRGFGWWMIEDKATGQTAGRTGIGHHIDWPEPELGWHLYEGFEGRGIAYEAALAAREYADGTLGLGPLISLIAPDNLRSRRLAERLGASVESETVIRGATCIVYRHPMGTA